MYEDFKALEGMYFISFQGKLPILKFSGQIKTAIPEPQLLIVDVFDWESPNLVDYSAVVEVGQLIAGKWMLFKDINRFHERLQVEKGKAGTKKA